MIEEFDVFVSYNLKDESKALELTERLKAKGVKPWLSAEQARLGEKYIKRLAQVIQAAPAAVILLGEHGMGQLQDEETQMCLKQSFRRPLPVITVLLPGAPTIDEFPFLGIRTRLDCRTGITDAQIDGLVRDITATQTLDTARELVADHNERDGQQQASAQFIDAFGVASVKSRLHALSEVVAQAASEQASLATATYKEDILSILVPITVDLRWKRAYATALEKMLKIPRPKKHISDFACEDVPEGCPLSEGILSARTEGEGRVVVLLDDQPALFVNVIEPGERDDLIESVNAHGRLGVASKSGLSLTRRIGEIPIRSSTSLEDEIATSLFQNREVLAPLIARLKMPGSDWLLTSDSADREEEVSLNLDESQRSRQSSSASHPEFKTTDSMVSEVFDANQAASADLPSARLMSLLNALAKQKPGM